MKRAILGVVTASLLATSAMAAEYVMKISHVVSSSTPKGIAANYLEKRIEELTNGKIDVQVFDNSQLYGDADEMRALAMNNVQVIMPSLSKFTSLAPQMQLFDLPFLFRDKAHLYAVMDGEVGDTLKSYINAKKQMLAFDYWDAGFKQFSSSKKAIINPEDAKGQKFRIQSSKVLEAQIKAVGGNPQILPFSEVYSALQQGVVDATENPLSNLYTKKFYEVQSSVTMSNHGYLGYLVVMNQQFWDKLPKDLQEHVKTAMKEATELERRETAIEDAKIIAALNDYARDSKKLEIFELTPEQIANWRKIMEGVYPEFYKVIGEDLIKKAIATQPVKANN
ncbi:DctP family TRAP transporter solute-binding subunit [Aliarcobacter skirrowii]|uniref:DctP family TRAP transporter solute-binding subunit n=1 Tax=Aliarcobacter skirrowii TaxID=28200 RepID=UPI0029B5A0F7|nr:DctP family TRAP transporter solute-binding subunit [Aliarcobacter skirrowii]MDX4050684.1 DctP family TRAP transporter solute-binding subunit [Aliarcobacter skirrowii]